jgi:glutamate racemase
MKSANGAIGVFDSGVGGLSVLHHLRKEYPHEDILYFADQAHVPYGSQKVADIRQYSEAITRFLLDQGAKVIVVACNTASAAALNFLRITFPDVPIVGMEPAVKPAAVLTKTGKVGVLATPGTFASPRYSSLMARFAEEVVVIEDPCIGLVDLIEQGYLETVETADLLRGILLPMLRADVDTLVLGCTHYPLVQPLIEDVVAGENIGISVTIIDPAPAVARQVGRVLTKSALEAPDWRTGSIHLFTSADTGILSLLARHALGEDFPVIEIPWDKSTLDTARSDSL